MKNPHFFPFRMHARRACSTTSFYRLRRREISVVAVLPSPPVYTADASTGAIADGVSVRLARVVADRMGVERGARFAPAATADFAEVGSPRGDLSVTNLGMTTSRCRSEGGLLYSDDQVG